MRFRALVKIPVTGSVHLRDVARGDLETFLEHQLDPDAARMAAFPSRDREAFMAHWTKILADQSNTIRTIIHDGDIAGNILSFQESGRMLVGYWVGKRYWGKGVATKALSQFLQVVKARPLYAYVAKHNAASIRVLQKCGFIITCEDPGSSRTSEGEVEEVLLKLEVGTPE